MLCVNKVMSLPLGESFDITSKMVPIYMVTNEHSMELAFMYFAAHIQYTINIYYKNCVS